MQPRREGPRTDETTTDEKVRSAYTRACYNPKFSELVKPLVEEWLPERLGWLSAFAAKSEGSFLLGSSEPMLPDVVFFDLLEQLSRLPGAGGLLGPELEALVKAMAGLFAEYLKDEETIDTPFNNLSATWIG